jgi:hypothetical protein
MVRLQELIGSTGGENDTHYRQWRSHACSCGSGKPKSAQYDARGIFLTNTCEDCHDRKMAEFRPDVLTDPDYWTDEPIDED